MKTETENINDELFCLKFELEALADHTIHKKSERWVPNYVSADIGNEHQARYDFASAFVKGKKVLDIAGGSGFGTYTLAQKGKAAEIISCDLSEDSIRYADVRYPHETITRLLMDAEQYKKENYFDVIVSFETVEHLRGIDAFLSHMAASLKDDGIFIVSTPVVNKTTTTCKNPYHVIEWSNKDFINLISKYFTVDKTYFQFLRFVSKKDNRYVKFIKRRLLNQQENKSAPVNYEPFEYTGQFDIEKILKGYQMLLCRKKK